MKGKRLFWVWSIGLSLLVVGSGFAAATFPERPINLIAPNPPGGNTDLQCRALAEAAKKFLPAPITIVNRPGGGGSVGMAEAIQAKPNGYTIGMASPSNTLLIPLISKVPFKAGVSDFRPVIKLIKAPVVFVVLDKAPWKSIADVVAYGKAHSGQVRVGTPGIGTFHHINLEMLKKMAKVDLTHVPFAGGAESITALLGEHIEAVIIPPSVVVDHVKAGKVRVLGNFDEKRHPLFPEAPTFREAGYDITQATYSFIIVAKGTPDPIVNILHDALKKAIETEFFKKFAEEGGYLIDYKGPAELKQELERDFVSFQGIIDKLNLKKK